MNLDREPETSLRWQAAREAQLTEHAYLVSSYLNGSIDLETFERNVAIALERGILYAPMQVMTRYPSKP